MLRENTHREGQSRSEQSCSFGWVPPAPCVLLLGLSKTHRPLPCAPEPWEGGDSSEGELPFKENSLLQFWYLYPNPREGAESRVGRQGYGAWLAQGVLLNFINLLVSQMAGAGEGRSEG